MKTFTWAIFIAFATLLSPVRLLASFEDSTVTYQCHGSGDLYDFTEEKYIYDSLGHLKLFTTYYILGNIHHVGKSNHYEYDISGNLIFSSDSSWDYFNQLFVIQRFYSYDNNGNVLTFETHTFQTGVEQPRIRTEYQYDLSGNLLVQTDFRGIPLDTISQNLYQYDTGGFIITMLGLQGSPLTNKVWTSYDLNSLGKDTIKIVRQWNGNSWDDSVRTLTEYQANDSVRVCGYNQHADSVVGWRTTDFDTCIYDLSNFLLEDIFYSINNGSIDTISREVYTYTSHVPLSYHYSYDYYYSGFWQPDSWDDKDFDLAGHLIYEYSSCYGCGEANKSYTYDSHDLLTSTSWYSITHGGFENSGYCDVFYYDVHGSFTLCQTDTLTLIADSGFVSYHWSTGATSQSILVSLPGTYIVSMIDSLGETWLAAPHIVGMKAPPVASHATDSVINICRNENILQLEEIDLPSYTYQWLINDTLLRGLLTNRNYINIIPGTAPSGIYRVRVSNECGFDTSTSTSINFSPFDVPSILPGATVTMCAGDTLAITASGGAHFDWIPTFDTTASILVTRPGIFTVQISDVPGCYATQACTVSTVDFSSTFIRMQNDSVLTYWNYGGGYAFANQWSWMFNGDTIAGAHSFTLNASQNGVYHVILQSSEGCIDTVGPYNYVRGGLTIFAGQDMSICSDNRVYIGVSSTGVNGRPPYQYTWMKDGALLTSGTLQSQYYQTNFIPTTTVEDTIVCVLIVTDSSGTIATDTLQVLVHPAPVTAPVITGHSVDTICRGVRSLLTASPVGNYYWYHNGIAYTTVLPNYWSANAAATYTCAYIDQYGCISPQSQPYTIYSRPDPVRPVIILNGTSPFCWGDSAEIITAYDSNLHYTWSGANTNLVLGEDTNVFLSTFTDNYTVYTTDTFGCNSLFANQVYVEFDTVFSFPITAYMPTVLCYGDSVLLTAPAFPTWSSQWMKDDIELPGTSDTFCYAKETGYYFMKVTNTAGCSAGSEKWLVQVRPQNTLTVTQSDSLLTASALFTSSYQWYNDSVFLVGEDSAIFIAHQSGNYFVDATDYHGCIERSDEYMINCQLTYAASQPVLCNGDCNAMITLSTNAIHPFNLHWSNGDTVGVADSLCAGSYWVTILDAWGCTDSLTFSINEPLPLHIMLQDSLQLNCFGLCDTVNAIVTGGTGGYNYSWSTGEVSSQALVCDTPEVIISVSDSNGCASLRSMTVLSADEPQFVFNATNPSCVGCNDGELFVQAVAGNPPFIFAFDSTDYALQNAGDTIHLYNLSDGNYILYLQGSNGCSSMDSIVLDSSPLSSEMQVPQNKTRIVPNPSTGYFAILHNSAERAQIQISELNGSIVYSGALDAETTEINGKTWGKGVYFVTIIFGSNVSVMKLVLQ